MGHVQAIAKKFTENFNVLDAYILTRILMLLVVTSRKKGVYTMNGVVPLSPQDGYISLLCYARGNDREAGK